MFLNFFQENSFEGVKVPPAPFGATGAKKTRKEREGGGNINFLWGVTIV